MARYTDFLLMSRRCCLYAESKPGKTNGVVH